jgi:hypothetical protein
MPNLYAGVTTINKRIFIRDYFRCSASKLCISYEQCKERRLETAGVIVVLMHEFAHFLLRAKIAKRGKFELHNISPGSGQKDRDILVKRLD